MATISQKTFVEMIAEIKKVSAAAKLPIEVEKDLTAYGIDGKILLDDITPTRHSEFWDMDFTMVLEYSTKKENWKQFLSRIYVMNKQLVDDTRYLFQGWTKIDDDEKLIYQATIVYKNIIGKPAV